MGEGLKQMFREVSSSSSSSRAEDEGELGEPSSLSGGSDDEAEEDAASPQNKTHADPLHELSSLVSQLPIKIGLSKFYQGKSQSFSSFSDVRCAEDLAKKENPIIKRKMKPSRSYAGGLDDDENHKSAHYGPKLPKNGPKGSCASSIGRTSSGCSYFAGGKPPPIPTHKNM